MNQHNHTVPECAVFVGVSLDGFIARANGDLDWLIGDVIPLFGSLSRDIRLRHVTTRTYPGGMVQSGYRIDA